MTTAHVHCLSHLPTAHEPALPRNRDRACGPVLPSGRAGADSGLTASTDRPPDRPAMPVTVGPMSARLPRSATCVIPMLP
jgi:hypothetical protein